MADKKALVYSTAGQTQQIQTGDVLTAPGTFASSTAALILATNSAGPIQLRPNGSASSTGEFVVASAGNVTINGSSAAVTNPSGNASVAITASGANTGFVQFTNITTGNLALINTAVDTMTIGTGTANVTRLTVTSALATFTVPITASNTITSTGTSAGVFFANRTGTARTYAWYGDANTVRLNVSGTGDVVTITEAGNISAGTYNGGSVTSSGTVKAASYFESSTTSWIGGTTGAGTVYLRPNGVGSTSGQTVLTSAGSLSSNNTAGAATTTATLTAANGSRYISAIPWISAGAYNGTNAAGDNAIIGFDTSVSTAILNLTVWSSTSVGVRITPTDVIVTGSAITLTGPVTGSSTISDSKGDVRVAVQNVQNTAYTLVLADGGKLLTKNDATARTHTIPANATVAYPIGTMLTFVNDNATNNLTISITTDTMYLAGTTTTGSRTLAPRGVATAIKAASTVWYISGAGLT